MRLFHSLRPAVFFFFIAATAFCFMQNTLNAERKYVGTIVAVVNGKIITREDVRRRAAGALAVLMSKYKGRELQRRAEETLQQVLGELIDRQLLVQKAHTIIDENPYVMAEIEKDLDQFIKNAVAEVGSISKFYEIAVKEGINPTEKKVELRDDLMVEKLLNSYVFSKISISPKGIREYYQEHRDEFVIERSVKIMQIMLKFSSYSSKEEAWEKAREIRQRALNGEDFGELLKEFSEGPRAPQGGVWEFDEVLHMRGRLKKGAMGLEKDEISEIVRSTRGLHVLLAVEVREEKEPDFQKLQEEIKSRLYKQKAAKKKREYIKDLKENAVIKVVMAR